MAAWRGFRIWCCECQRINNTSYAQLFLSVLTPNQVITLTKMHFTSFIAMCVCYWGYDRSLRSERFDPRRWWRKNVTIFVWKLFFVVPTPTNWSSDYLFFVCRISIYYLITDFNVEFWIISLVNGREWWVFLLCFFASFSLSSKDWQWLVFCFLTVCFNMHIQQPTTITTTFNKFWILFQISFGIFGAVIFVVFCSHVLFVLHSSSPTNIQKKVK